MARHSFNSGIHSGEIIIMRHLALDVHLESPFNDHNGTLEVAQALREKIDNYKFNNFVKVVIVSYSQYDQSAFTVANAISSFIEIALESVNQVVSMNVRTHRDCWELVHIDIIEVTE